MQTGYRLSAREITVARAKKVILNNVSFDVFPNTLTAIIGPNGAGKSTLMRALSGELPDEGQVLINGQDIYKNPEFWLRYIGYIPVDTILHENLELEEALLFTGKLRLPDLSSEQIQERVNILLTKFGFPPEDDRRKKLIKVLSSGELKRANIISELIIDPKIILLDEPTSNLDPNAEYEVMSLLGRYAHDNHKTIIVITHTLNTIDLCDEVIYIENGIMRKKGPPHVVLDLLLDEFQLNPRNRSGTSTFYLWAQVFDKTKTRPAERIDYKSVQKKRVTVHRSLIPAPKAVSWFHQFCYLFSRYFRTRLNDRSGLVLTLLAGLSGILFFTLPSNTFVKPFDFNERVLALNQARQSIYVIAIVTTLIGIITSYTEISREFRIYSHERLKGLSSSAYFLSKWVWLAIVVGVLAPVLLLFFIVLVYRQPLPGFPSPRIGEAITWADQVIKFQLVGLLTQRTSWLLLLTLILSCITSVTLGLLISAASGSSSRGYLYLSFVVVFIVLFSGLMRNAKLENLIDTLSYLSTGKWAYEGVASSLSIYCWIDSWRFDEFNSTGHLISIWLSLGAFIIAAGSLVVIFLRLRDPWYSHFTNFRLLFSRNLPRIAVITSVFILIISYAVFFRTLSYEYHKLNYFNRAEYGGNNAYQYANIMEAINPSGEEQIGGLISQSWCVR